MPPATGLRRAEPVSCGITVSGNQGGLRLPPKAMPGRRHAKVAAAPLNQSREAHLAARPLHSPEGARVRASPMLATDRLESLEVV
jgi:hypothetical protein